MSDFDLRGKYDLRGVLGRGAMGTVYDGWDPRIDRRVAIKTVRRPSDGDEEAVEALARFKQEAKAAGRLAHPHIVGVYDYGETDEYAYIVMEFVEGRSLKARLDEAGRLAPAEAGRIMLEVLSGLAYSHARGVIHRDIKPANIILTGTGEAKIADFGVARLENSDMTSVGTMIGTPSYMAPEQFLGEGVDARSDLYAAGVTLFHTLTGERPYEGGMTSIMHRVLKTEDPPPRATERLPAISPLLDAAVAKAMAKRAADRFQDAGAFALALRIALAAPPEPASELAPETSGEEDDDEATVFGRAAPVLPHTVPAERPALPEPQAEPRPPALPTLPKNAPSRLPLVAGLGLAALLAAASGAWLLLRTPSAPPAPAAITPAPPPQTAPAIPAVPAQPTPQAAPAPSAFRDAVAARLAVEACVSAQVTVAGDSVAVAGIAESLALPRLRDLAGLAAPGQPLGWTMQGFDGPYCPVLNLLRAETGTTLLAVALVGGDRVLRDGDDVLPRITAPAFPAYVHVDYFAHDGTVAHIYPRGKNAPPMAPGTKLDLGAELTGKVGPPYGTDLIFSVATSAPLALRRKLVEPTAAYLAALRASLDSLRKSGAQVAAGATVVKTAPH